MTSQAGVYFLQVLGAGVSIVLVGHLGRWLLKAVKQAMR